MSVFVYYYMGVSEVCPLSDCSFLGRSSHISIIPNIFASFCNLGFAFISRAGSGALCNLSDLLTHKLTSVACHYFDANLHEVFVSEKQKQNTQKNITQTKTVLHAEGHQLVVPE